MKFMNDYDIQSAVQRHISNTHPNRLAAAYVIQNLAEWADTVSDGWHSWPKPCRAASGLIDIADVFRADADVTDDELAAAARPVKAFLTRCAKQRHGLHPNRSMVTADERERILRSVTA